MSWEKEVLEIEHRKALALAQGGPEAIALQHAKGRLTIRERIDAVLDVGTFVEHGPGAGFATQSEAGEITDFSPANYVVGFGAVLGRQVVVGGEDFTLKHQVGMKLNPVKGKWLTTSSLAVNYIQAYCRS